MYLVSWTPALNKIKLTEYIRLMTSNHLSGRMTISHGLIYFYTPEVQLNCHMSPVLTSDRIDTTRPAHSYYQEVNPRDMCYINMIFSILYQYHLEFKTVNSIDQNYEIHNCWFYLLCPSSEPYRIIGDIQIWREKTES